MLFVALPHACLAGCEVATAWVLLLGTFIGCPALYGIVVGKRGGVRIGVGLAGEVTFFVVGEGGLRVGFRMAALNTVKAPSYHVEALGDSASQSAHQFDRI